jgi:hypothetical protein
MAKKNAKKPSTKKPDLSQRVKIAPEESLKRMADFHRRKETFIAAVRKGKNRSVSA